MSLYFGTTEITDVNCLVPNEGKDISQIFFGGTELFTAFNTCDGTLPAQFDANGEDLADYRVYGSSGGVGDASGTAYGYSVQMSVGSGNLFDPSDTTPNYRYDDAGNFIFDSGVLSSGSMKIAAGDKYEYNFKTVAGKNSGVCRVNYLNANGQWLSVNKVSFNAAVGATVTVSGTAPAGTAFIRTSQYSGEQNISMTRETDIPIYIGSSPLGADEYVSFSEQKIYRMTNSALTPTDPPTPLPALPTCEGTTIIDYAGQSQAGPERFFAKYRKNRS